MTQKMFLTAILIICTFSCAFGQNFVNDVVVTAANTNSASLNLQNNNGFWHLSGPRSGENMNNLTFFWNNTQYFVPCFTLLSNGNLGLGTTNPQARLHLDGPLDGSLPSIRIGSASTGNMNVPYGATTGGYNMDFMTWRDVVPNQVGARIRAERINSWQDNAALKQSMDLAFYTSSGEGEQELTEKLRIKSNGSVGIGVRTFEPYDKLVVNGNIKAILDPDNPKKNVSSLISLGFSGITGAQNWALRGVYAYGNGVSQNTDGGDLDLIKSLDGNTILATKTDGMPLGNVGIGTINTRGYKLAVNGTVRAQAIRVEAGSWPDYVFGHTYRLRTLAGVQAYIQKNNHLPDLPSAAQVSREGVDLGEMDRLLVKKVEELTLYLIARDKQMSAQQKLIKDLQARLRKLEGKQH